MAKKDYSFMVSKTYGGIKVLRVFLKQYKRQKSATVEYICSCGRKKDTFADNVLRGRTRNCPSCPKTKHGMVNERIYNTWSGMVQRCINKKSQAYKNYGGRGISVCDRWLKFENFYADMGDRPGDLTLDRTDNEKGYSKENCRWATWEQQANNRRFRKNGVVVDYLGENMSLSAAASKFGISHQLAFNRLRNGWGTEEILSIPAGSGRARRLKKVD